MTSISGRDPCSKGLKKATAAAPTPAKTNPMMTPLTRDHNPRDAWSFGVGRRFFRVLVWIDWVCPLINSEECGPVLESCEAFGASVGHSSADAFMINGLGLRSGFDERCCAVDGGGVVFGFGVLEIARGVAIDGGEEKTGEGEEVFEGIDGGLGVERKLFDGILLLGIFVLILGMGRTRDGS